MGRGKLEELELSWVKAEDEELGKSKKPGSLKSSSFSKKRLCQLYRKPGVSGSAHHRGWVWL